LFMKKVFKEGRDIHTATAAEIFEMPPEKVGKDERRYAKVINFGILYGLSAYGLTQQVPGISRDRAQAFIDKYFLTYQGVKKYTEEIVAQTRKEGFVANELGRKRYLPEINSSQFQVRAGAERAAINTPIQSLAADIIKVAMINVHHEIGTENPECKMLLQVHDELLFEVEKEKVDHYAKKIKKIMEEAISLSVPVEVEAKAGENWGEMEKISM
ncbi:MAG: DNA polymerase, partial [Patescibacteria group bacterium]